MMPKEKLLNLALVVTSLFGYMEWGGDNHSFLFQAEAEVFAKFFSEPSAILHPFVLLPFLGQFLLLLSLLQNKPSRMLTFLSIGALGLLLGFMFIIGLISMKPMILLSCLPFLITAFFTVHYHRKTRS